MSFDQNRNRVADGIERGGDKLGEAIRPSSYSQTRQYGRDLKEDVKEGARDARDGTKAFGNELREDMREGAQDAKDAAHRAKEAYKATPTPPAYSDIAKAATDVRYSSHAWSFLLITGH